MYEKIRAAAVKLIKKDGFANLSRPILCDVVGINPSSFTHFAGISYTDFVEKLRDEGVKGNESKINRPRVDARTRKNQILNAAVKCAVRSSYDRITRAEIAEEAKIPATLVTHHLGTMPKLKREVMRRAIAEGNAVIVAQGLANKDPRAKNASTALHAKALEILLGDASASGLGGVE